MRFVSPAFKTKIATFRDGKGFAQTSIDWFCKVLNSMPGEPAQAWSIAIASLLVIIGQTLSI